MSWLTFSSAKAFSGDAEAVFVASAIYIDTNGEKKSDAVVGLIGVTDCKVDDLIL